MSAIYSRIPRFSEWDLHLIIIFYYYPKFSALYPVNQKPNFFNNIFPKHSTISQQNA